MRLGHSQAGMVMLETTERPAEPPAVALAALHALTSLHADQPTCGERAADQQPQDCRVEDCVDGEAGPGRADRKMILHTSSQSVKDLLSNSDSAASTDMPT